MNNKKICKEKHLTNHFTRNIADVTDILNNNVHHIQGSRISRGRLLQNKRQGTQFIGICGDYNSYSET